MKIMRLGIIVLMVAALLCGCSGNKETSTNEVSEADVSAVISDENTSTSDISFSEGETTAELEVTASEETQEQEENSSKQSTSSQNASSQTATISSRSGNTTTGSQPPPKEPKQTDTPSKAEEKPKSAFAKPFDTGTMKSELISYGSSIGMTHITNFSEDFGGGQITPDGTTWLPPHETWMYNSSSADKLKQDLCDRIKRWKNNGESTYTLWFEKDSNHSGDYIIYVIIG